MVWNRIDDSPDFMVLDLLFFSLKYHFRFLTLPNWFWIFYFDQIAYFMSRIQQVDDYDAKKDNSGNLFSMLICGWF